MIPTKRLSEVAIQMNDGDLLLWRGSGLAGACIRIGTVCLHTHAGMLVKEGATPYIAEMTFAGGHVVDLYSQVRDTPGAWEWRPVADRYRDLDRVKSAAMMREFAKRKYGTGAVLRAALRHAPLIRVLLAPLWKGDEIDDVGADVCEHPAFCSEAVAVATQLGGGIDPVPGLTERLTEPAHLAHSLLWDVSRACSLVP